MDGGDGWLGSMKMMCVPGYCKLEDGNSIDGRQRLEEDTARL